jgi:hypothetical protein
MFLSVVERIYTLYVYESIAVLVNGVGGIFAIWFFFFSRVVTVPSASAARLLLLIPQCDFRLLKTKDPVGLMFSNENGVTVGKLDRTISKIRILPQEFFEYLHLVSPL